MIDWMPDAVALQTENGLLGVGPTPGPGEQEVPLQEEMLERIGRRVPHAVPHTVGRPEHGGQGYRKQTAAPRVFFESRWRMASARWMKPA